jgi:hypothetical protein
LRTCDAKSFWQGFQQDYFRLAGKEASSRLFWGRYVPSTGYVTGDDLVASNNHHLSLSLSLAISSHQRFFLQLLLAFKVVDCVSIALEALASDCAVVIGLFSTGESHVDDRVRELDDIISAPR